MSTVELEFESLPMRRREMVKFSSNQYRILDSKGEFKNVEANTAYEAFKLSGLTDAIKIERMVNIKPAIITQAEFVEKAIQAAANNNAAETTTTEEAMTEAALFEQSRRLMQTVISANDLDKFMQSRISTEPVAETSNSATGTEVHGDGFDEIIPSATQPAAKAATHAKEVQHVEIPHGVPEQPVTPEKSLSPEEVEKLLNTNG